MKNRIVKSLFSGFFFVAIAFQGHAQSVPEITCVEEDWEMVLGDPDPVKASPQILTWMSPTASLDEEHFGIDMNHVERPDFTSGGFQTKALNGETLVANSFSENGDKFTEAGETIRWTQRMLLSGNQLSFEVANGSSQSWGTFGGPNTRVKFQATLLTNLNSYSPSCSLEWSGVGYGGNRVDHLRLKTVRLLASDGTVYTIPIDTDIQ